MLRSGTYNAILAKRVGRQYYSLFGTTSLFGLAADAGDVIYWRFVKEVL